MIGQTSNRADRSSPNRQKLNAGQMVGEYPFPANAPTDKPTSVLVSVENGQLMIEVPKFIPKMEAVMQSDGTLFLTLENGFEWSFTKGKTAMSQRSNLMVESSTRKIARASKFGLRDIRRHHAIPLLITRQAVLC